MLNSTLLSRYLPGAILRQPRPILLLSHMRGYTSLISHILGSNPYITGHFELHRSYERKLDNLRAQITLSNLLGSSIATPFYLDKVLHNTHYVTARFLNSGANPIVLISVREPEGALTSLIRFGEFQRDKHELVRLSDPREAMRYYINRLVAIRDDALKVPGGFLYFSADELVSDPAKVLSRVWSHIGVEGDLSGNYTKDRFTGDSYRGDYSDNIQAGEIRKERNSARADVAIPQHVIDIACQYHYDISTELNAASA